MQNKKIDIVKFWVFSPPQGGGVGGVGAAVFRHARDSGKMSSTSALFIAKLCRPVVVFFTYRRRVRGGFCPPATQGGLASPQTCQQAGIISVLRALACRTQRLLCVSFFACLFARALRRICMLPEWLQKKKKMISLVPKI